MGVIVNSARGPSVLDEVDETPISDIHIHTDLLIIFIT
jgi:hypothetical protein